ncbi:MAG: polysaccharide biosynthesis tyrosine autokinase [Scytonematopsis contorta HA4267-MV1]|jgi:capsular exopolysaccharide synthesis family protein|nr:polysaccharide biosynthesis tyrosine autokinase [Scytonematopsis contorta HA4267-MV1]
MENKNDTQELDIQQYWLPIKRRWPFLVIALLASLGIAGFAILKRKPEYEATGMLLFKSDRISSLTKAGEKIGDLESLVRGNPLETQAVIVNSQPILREVINTLGLKDKQGKLLEPELLKIKVESIVGTDVLKVSYTSENPEISASVVNQLMKSYVANNIESNRTQVVVAGEFLKKQLPVSRQELERASEAIRQFKTQYKIIQLPQEASAAIQNISQLDVELNQTQAALADVSAQEGQIASQLNFAKNKTVEITSLNQIPGVQEVLGELQKVQSKLASARARYTEEHPDISNLKNQEITLNALLQNRTEQVLGTKKIVPSNQLQVGKLRETLASQYVQLQTQRQGLENKIRALSNIRETYQQKLAILPNLEKTQGDLERKLSVAQTDYQNLITRLQEIEVAEKQTIGNAKIIQTAEIPKNRVISKITFMLAGGSIFFGLLMGIFAAYFVDVIDRSLKNIKEIETFFGYTLIGLIPKFETNIKSPPIKLIRDEISSRVVVATSPRTVIHEAYQMLQANLKFISHKKVSTIVVTSSVTGEGKSEVSANLAAIIATAGKRVLLVDADMRQPCQHHLWGLINSVGLSNVIVGHDEFSQAVQTVTSYLSVLTAGVQPPNPSALIDSEGMISLIQKFSETYDYIIFDTPPLTGIADAAVLGKMVDGVLLVARPRVVESASAKAAKSLLERSEANILGIIANAVNIKQEPDSYFYYSYPRSGHIIKDAEVSIR